MNESDVARRVAGSLSASAHRIDAAVAERLRCARERALAVQRPARWQSGWLQRGLALRLRWVRAPLLRATATALLLLAVFVAGDYWSTLSRINERQAIDAALLMDDLPIDAYLDPDFKAWLSRESHSSSSAS
jgi:hypothetical protein